ncbi:hypothetical protein GTA08_BOTSDO13584 [Botryosphaeria dothidea]|uniref:Uncharacterized protein n=1 Tax=Botryosphaeria dothidea TaxID=55169 RepID=A0A8H4ND63_9PEZI|nr:hypothetical protein GTA08_BOTSDO13584 [Botryosphaeria dothidea]
MPVSIWTSRLLWKIHAILVGSAGWVERVLQMVWNHYDPYLFPTEHHRRGLMEAKEEPDAKFIAHDFERNKNSGFWSGLKSWEYLAKWFFPWENGYGGDKKRSLAMDSHVDPQDAADSLDELAMVLAEFFEQHQGLEEEGSPPEAKGAVNNLDTDKLDRRGIAEDGSSIEESDGSIIARGHRFQLPDYMGGHCGPMGSWRESCPENYFRVLTGAADQKGYIVAMSILSGMGIVIMGVAMIAAVLWGCRKARRRRADKVAWRV